MKKILSALACMAIMGCSHQPITPASFTIAPVTNEPRLNTGSLSVQIQGTARKPFSVLATVKDISSLKITVSGANLPVALTQKFTDTDISAGNTSAVFGSLPVGPVTIDVAAYDVHGTLLGSTSATASIVAKQTTTVCLVVKLDANVGNLAVGVSFQEVTPTITKTKVDCPVCN